eukprot:COSAG05_NODE_106_length_18750_cov_677.083105_11_plen_43_part_00
MTDIYLHFLAHVLGPSPSLPLVLTDLALRVCVHIIGHARNNM